MIKYLIMDVDGTLTDGKIYMGSDGEAMKAFSIKDGYVCTHILKAVGIIPVVLTARISKIVQNRCDELGIKDVYQGRLDKLTILKEIVGEDGLKSCAYIGDDLLDLKCMALIKGNGGIVGCPADAVQEVKGIADFICTSKAGEGALREFTEWLIVPHVDKNEVIERVDSALAYLLALNVSDAACGRHEVNNDFFYLVQSYKTKPVEECKMESHRKYADIQIMVKGNESIDLADVSRLTVKEEYDSEKDVMFWSIPRRMARVTLKAGDYIILYPENAHRGGVGNGEDVLKIVGKVRVD